MTYFGLTTADNWVLTPDDTDAQGKPVFTRPSGFGFFIVIEAKAGTSGLLPRPTFQNINPSDPTKRPDIQIEANQSLGTGAGRGSLAICDVGPPPAALGGVPGIAPPSFDSSSQFIANALNDFGCRFDNNTVDKCTKIDDSGFTKYVMAGSAAQYCTLRVVGAEMAFPPGDTLLTVQLRDYPVGNIGDPVSIVIRVPSSPPTNSPTSTSPPTLTPTVTRTGTSTRTRTVTSTPTITPTSVPSSTPTSTPLPTLTATRTATPVPSATATATPVPSATATAIPTAIPTATATPTPSLSPTPAPSSTATPSSTPSETPTATWTPSATETETSAATETATATATDTPGG